MSWDSTGVLNRPLRIIVTKEDWDRCRWYRVFRNSLSGLRNVLSRRVLTVLAVLFMIFLTSGGIFLLVLQPGSMVSTSTGSSFMARSSTSQTSTEFFVALFLTVAGMAGFVLLEGALKRSFDLSASKQRYLMALILIVLSIGLLEYLFYAKFY
jgi:hypothetical protein